MFSLKCAIFIAFLHYTSACSYKLISSGNNLGQKTNYVAGEYCDDPLIDVDVSSFVAAKFSNKQFCGLFQNGWSDLNSSIVITPLGHGDSWIVTSSRVMRDCMSIPDKVSVSDPSEKVKIVSLCWQACSYRWGGTFPSLEPPSTFEYLFSPFKSERTAKSLMSQRMASSGFSEFSSVMMLLTAVDYDNVKLLFDATVTAAIKTTVYTLADSTVLLSAFLEYSSDFLNNFMFGHTLDASGKLGEIDEWSEDCDASDTQCDYKVFWEKVGGCVTDESVICPALACGDVPTDSAAVVTAHAASLIDGNSNNALIDGSLDGEDIKCAAPFIGGYMKGSNTTESGEETLAAALSLQLVKTSPIRSWKMPSIIGSFEDLVNAVCPHSWYAMNNDPEGWASTIDVMDEEFYPPEIIDPAFPDAQTVQRSLSFYDRCHMAEFDAMSSRYLLPTSSAYQYGQSVMYMPSAIESYSYAFFLKYASEYTDGDWSSAIFEERMMSLLLMKLRYREHEAEHHAVEDVNSFNSRTLVAGACDGNIDDYYLFDSEHAEIKSIPVVGDNEDPCVYMNLLLSLSEQCREFSHHGAAITQAGACRTAILDILTKLQGVCEGECSANIMDNFFCTQITALTNGYCGNRYVIDYYVSTSMSTCSSWYAENMPETCDAMGLQDPQDYSFDLYGNNLAGFVASNYYGGFSSGCGCGRRLGHDGNGGGGSLGGCGSCDSCGRRLGHDGNGGSSSSCGRRLGHDVAGSAGSQACTTTSSGRRLGHDGATSSPPPPFPPPTPPPTSSAVASCSASNPSCVNGRRLGHDVTGGGTQASNCRRLTSVEELGHFKFKDTTAWEDRRLGHVPELSFFEDQSSIDNRIPVKQEASVDGSDRGFISFGDFGNIEDTAILNYEQLASNMIDATIVAFNENNADRVSLLSYGFGDLAVDSHDAAELRTFFGEFLHLTAQVWLQASSSDTYVPIFAMCDPEFEESLTRDNIELKNMKGSQYFQDGRRLEEGACDLGPSIAASTIARLSAQNRWAMQGARFFF